MAPEPVARGWPSMPKPERLAKAELQDIYWDNNGAVHEGNPERNVTVQFNPETLTVTYTNQNAGGDQRGGSALQFVGKGTTKLGLDLWFDVTEPLPDGSREPSGDVRKLTEKVNYFIRPQPVEGQADKWIPPGVRFLWGTFLFEGVVDSITERLEYFSPDGKPLRANVNLSLTSQDIQFQFGRANPSANGQTGPDTQPQRPAQEGESLQQMVAASGSEDWRSVAEANGIENPRMLRPGIRISLKVGRG